MGQARIRGRAAAAQAAAPAAADGEGHVLVCPWHIKDSLGSRRKESSSRQLGGKQGAAGR